MKEEEEEFLKVLESRAAENNGKIEVVDIYKKKSEVEVKELITLSKLVEKVKETYPGFKFYQNCFFLLKNDATIVYKFSFFLDIQTALRQPNIVRLHSQNFCIDICLDLAACKYLTNIIYCYFLKASNKIFGLKCIYIPSFLPQWKKVFLEDELFSPSKS